MWVGGKERFQSAGEMKYAGKPNNGLSERAKKQRSREAEKQTSKQANKQTSKPNSSLAAFSLDSQHVVIIYTYGMRAFLCVRSLSTFDKDQCTGIAEKEKQKKVMAPGNRTQITTI